MACRSGSEFYSSLCAFAINDDRTDKLSSALPLFNFFWISHRRVEMKPTCTCDPELYAFLAANTPVVMRSTRLNAVQCRKLV